MPDFLDPALAAKMSEAFPAPDSPAWVQYKHYNENKQGLFKRDALPPLIGEVFDELNSPAFLAWLSALTGIPNLLADPSLEGGGLHQSVRGGFLNIHADFTTHRHNTHWRRRVNVIVYLNPGWRPEWGGAIEFWDPTMRRCVVKIPPLANHAAVFNTDELSYHGFPEAITCPPGVTRRSIALYYYTAETPGNIVSKSTNYQARPGDGARKATLIWADKQVVRLYSWVKLTLGLSDDFASRVLGFFARFKK